MVGILVPSGSGAVAHGVKSSFSLVCSLNISGHGRDFRELSVAH